MDRYSKYLAPQAARAVLTNRTLRWSRPSRINDIFDMTVPYSIGFDADYVRRRAVELMWERVQNPGKQEAANQMGDMLEAMRHRCVARFRFQVEPGRRGRGKRSSARRQNAHAT